MSSSEKTHSLDDDGDIDQENDDVDNLSSEIQCSSAQLRYKYLGRLTTTKATVVPIDLSRFVQKHAVVRCVSSND